LRYLTPLVLYRNNTLYTIYLSYKREEGKGRKNYTRKTKDTHRQRQKFTAREKLNNKIKTTSYKLELLITKLFPPKPKSIELVNRNS